MILYISGSTQENNVGVNGYGTEEHRMQELADKVAWHILNGKGNITVYRNNGNMTLAETIADSNSKNANYHLALHTNAGGRRGTECYWYHATNGDGKEWAQAIYNAVAPLTVSLDRGCMPDSVLYSIGLAELRETNAIACLIEIIFHDNQDDVNDYLAKVDLIALYLAKEIYKYFNIKYIIEQPQSERDLAISYINEVSKWGDIYIKYFDDMVARGVNIYGLLCKIKNL